MPEKLKRWLSGPAACTLSRKLPPSLNKSLRPWHTRSDAAWHPRRGLLRRTHSATRLNLDRGQSCAGVA